MDQWSDAVEDCNSGVDHMLGIQTAPGSASAPSCPNEDGVDDNTQHFYIVLSTVG